ncbi:hypothetical protein CEY00_Acc13401 [Actinidia chinensis var. chinensis]|uniref:AB hydrolase-1 domain-containing protein n=1 Tax=Actinidia chinensis var. chinensis TaxID=1590841 RepID=A0A2R6QVX4_ACTCC|nr:hypothetical protein CEY00_Acc13401 [Actinidia chinensis var. chinensis]
MARSIRNKPGLAILNRFLISQSPGLWRSTATRSLETLAFEEVRSSTERPYKFTAFVLHGLLGSARNWRSFSRNLASYLSNSFPSSDWRMVLVDLRNHGRSAEKIESFSPPHDMASAAKDLADLINTQGWAWPDVILGHSMGGKVALQFTESCARGDYGESAQLPKQLWVLDSVPGIVKAESGGEVEKVLLTLQNLTTPIPSRKWLVDYMIQRGLSKSLSEWIGSNLKRTEHGTWTWAFNLEAAVQMFNSFWESDYCPFVENPPKEMETHILRAENSDRWDPDMIQKLESLASRRVYESDGKLFVHVLPNAGHWVHVDNPKGLLEIVAPRIATLA